MNFSALNFIRKIPYAVEETAVWVRLNFSREGLRKNRSWWGSMLIAFGLTLVFMFMSFERAAQVRQLKRQIVAVEEGLNEFGWDFAYDNIEFGYLFTNALVKVDNLTLYNPEQQISLIIPRFKISPSLLNLSLFNVSFGGKQELKIATDFYPILADDDNLKVQFKDGKIESILASWRDISIKNFAHIAEFNYAGRQTENRINLSGPNAVFENHAEVKNVTLNQRVNHPLGREIEQIYVKLEQLGEIKAADNWHQAAQNWLQDKGYFNISNLMIKWQPFSLVGKGELNFNENLQPIVRLNTSSKALLELLNDLQERQIVERKGVFVANILLGNKAFRLKEDDDKLTIVTPMNYRDGEITIENVSIKRF